MDAEEKAEAFKKELVELMKKYNVTDLIIETNYAYFEVGGIHIAWDDINPA